MKETKEEKKAREAEDKARKEAERAAKERANREAKEGKMAPAGSEATRDELYQGAVSLMVSTPIDLIRLRELEESLDQVEDLHLDLIGGSISEGTEIVVSVKKPLPLLDILNGMAPVEQATKKGKKIQIVLKAA
jgi:hypothetical protein